MSSDQQVTAKIVVQALLEFERRGVTATLQNLEGVEPDLSEFVLERMTDIHHEILALGGPPKASRRAYRRVQTLVLVTIAALRRSHFELWRQDATGTRLDQIDPSLEPPPESGPSEENPPK